MAWTEDDATALRAAIARGVRSVTYGNRVVQYHSLDEMLRALVVIETALAAETGTATNRYAGFSKGLSGGRSNWDRNE